jgi:hypothetical protein
MRIASLTLLGLGLQANGLFMLFAPEPWYGLIPGVRETGPFNPHFVRDIGSAYGVAGASLLALIRWPGAWPAAIAGSTFLVLHAGVHLFDALHGRIHLHHLATDAVAVLLPALLALFLAWPRARVR